MVGIQRIAELLNLTPRHCQRLVAEGMPKAKRGLYDELACLSWYVRYLQAKLQSGPVDPGGDGGDPSGLTGRHRLDEAKAALAEYDLAEKRRLVLTVPDWERALADIITPARHELLSIEARLRHVIGADAAAKVGEEIRRSLRGFVSSQEQAS